MLADKEKKILEVVRARSLITIGELNRMLSGEGVEGVGAIVQKLMQMNYLTTVEPLGRTCIVLTNTGTRALRG